MGPWVVTKGSLGCYKRVFSEMAIFAEMAYSGITLKPVQSVDTLKLLTLVIHVLCMDLNHGYSCIMLNALMVDNIF